eukprot:101908_1
MALVLLTQNEGMHEEYNDEDEEEQDPEIIEIKQFITKYKLKKIENAIINEGLTINFLLSRSTASIKLIANDLTNSYTQQEKFIYAVDQIKNEKNNKNKAILKVKHEEKADITYSDKWSNILKSANDLSPQKCSAVTLTINNNILTQTHGGGWGTSFLTNIVCSGKHHWKFKIINELGGNLRIGLWNNAYDPKIALNVPLGGHLPYSPNTAYSLDIVNGHLCNHYARMPPYIYPQYVTEKCKKGSIISMYVDFNNLCISYVINNKNWGKAFDIVQEKYTAAVTLNYHDAIELLLYEKL